MNLKLKRIFSIIFMLAFSLSLFVGQTASYAANGGVGLVNTTLAFTDVTGKVDLSGIARSNFNSSVLSLEHTNSKTKKTVIVSLSGETLFDGITADGDAQSYLSSPDGIRAARSIKNTQNTFIKRMNAMGIDYEVVNTYNAVDNALAIKVDASYISQIKDIANVNSVVVSESYTHPQVSSSDGTVGVSNDANVYNTGIYDTSEVLKDYSGQGMVVAVLDTGLDYTHTAFNTYHPDFDSEKVALTKTGDNSIKSILDSRQLAAETKTELSGGKIDENDVYVSAKVPFAYDYADDDCDVYPSYSNHGTHVAGIIAGYDPSGYNNKDGEHVNETFIGVAPNAQLVICKVFTDDLEDPELGGADTEDILAALDDCIKLNVDVINMSLGTSCGFSSTEGDSEGDYMSSIYDKITESDISLVVAASNDYSSGYGGNFGTNLRANPDSGTVGSPSTYAGALSVASISGQKSSYLLGNEGVTDDDGSSVASAVFYFESSDENSVEYDFAGQLLENDLDGVAEYEYVVVPGVGRESDYTTVRSLFREKNRIALVKRGDTTFQEKVETAMSNGAAAIIIYNNVAGSIRMNLGEVDDPIPAISVTLDAGTSLIYGAKAYSNGGSVGKIKVDKTLEAGPFMSDFSSWGPTPDLKLKPEITAHGGEITSVVPGGYDEYSGTSMACPNMAGALALIREYVRNNEDLQINAPNSTKKMTVSQLATQLFMGTATIAIDPNELPYSPRKQGAGLANIENALYKSTAIVYTDDQSTGYRPKLEFGDNTDGEYTSSFYVTNFGSQTPLNFTLKSLFMTETLSMDGLAVAEKAHMLNDNAKWLVDDQLNETGNITVEKGQTVKISVTLTLTDEEKEYINKNFPNGMYAEGFIQLLSNNANQCNLVIPFLGFYGDWASAPMLDYDAYEISEIDQDASKNEDEKEKASVWATQPFTSYYNEKYILPMGSYLYELPESAEKMYTDMEYNSVSRYNTYVDEDGYGNYLTSTAIKAVYAGLLRNSRTVDYTLSDAYTGEILLSDTIYRVGKAYAAGGSARPANVKLDLSPEEMGLSANGKYQMDFTFSLDIEGYQPTEDDTFSFTFYVDYEAPILQNARVRYYNYKDGNKQKQRIYLDFDVFDNHYAQSVMLCYLDNKLDGNGNPVRDSSGEIVRELKLATDYITPIRNPKKNGLTTVSIEVTDIYEKLGNQLYIQLDDYSLNHSVYYLDLNASNAGVLPENFEIEENDRIVTEQNQWGISETTLKLDLYETYKIPLVYDGDADPSNFSWSSGNASVARVKNGEVVGIREGSSIITVSNGKKQKTIKVIVSDSDKTLSYPSISFGTIKTSTESVVKAQGFVDVNPNSKFKLDIVADPWYYPTETLDITWESTAPDVATVDQNGNVHTLKKGVVSITAKIVGTMYAATVTLNVGEEFVVSNFTLTAYHGTAEVVEIPTDMNIMYIGERAFEYNNYITEVIIPKTVTEIQYKAFSECTALKRVSFISKQALEIADADLTIIHKRAFYNCPMLEVVDLSNVKTITVASEVFAGCKKLSSIIKMENIGTMYNMAFADCQSLNSINISNLHVAGYGVFSGCTGLNSVKTGYYTKIGDGMFSGCTALSEITISTPNIGSRAFENCTSLTTVKFENPVGYTADFVISDRAFYGAEKLSNVSFGSCVVRSIGSQAFCGTALKEFTMPNGLQNMSQDALIGTDIAKITLNDSFDISQVYSSHSPFKDLEITEYSAPASSVRYDVDGEGIVYSKGYETLLLVPSAKQDSFEINPLTTAFADNAFYGVKSVVGLSDGYLIFKDGEKSLISNIFYIGNYTFAHSGLTIVELSAKINKIGVGAFAYTDINTFSFGEAQITSIPAYAFTQTKISSVVIPQSVKEICDYAFSRSTLSSFSGFVGETLGNGVFEGCNNLQSITLHDGIKQMGDSVFANTANLKTAVMPSVEVLGSFTFMNAASLTEVVFGKDAKTVGSFTFVNRQGYTLGENNTLESVTLGSLTENVGEYAFYGCSALSQVKAHAGQTLNVKTVGDYAFYGCSFLTTAEWLDGAEEISIYAFANSGLTSVSLANAKTVAEGAFAENTALQSANIQNVKRIGNFAFFNSGLTAITIPSSMAEVGAGAFAGCKSLSAISVDDGNNSFISENGVLYRAVGSGYELVAYPSDIVQQTYSIKDGTSTVGAYAFYGVGKGNVEKVIFPYSIKQIGDFAFFSSGIEEYEFHSINAPILQTSYKSEVDQMLSQIDTVNTIGFFYTNFEDYFINYSEFGNKTTKLKISYASNGVGYDNFVYKTYFGQVSLLGTLIEDATRNVISMISALPSVSEIQEWLNLDVTDNNKDMVSAMSQTVIDVRRSFNTIKDAEQQAFIDQSVKDKLVGVEDALKAVKERFGLQAQVTGLTAPTGYKQNYFAGEFFDMTGLTITVNYDDGTTAQASGSDLTLKTQKALTVYTKYVEVSAFGKTVRVPVTVTKIEDSSSSSSDSNTSESVSAPSDSDVSDKDGLPAIAVVGIIAACAAAVGGIGFAVFKFTTKKK